MIGLRAATEINLKFTLKRRCELKSRDEYIHVSSNYDDDMSYISS